VAVRAGPRFIKNEAETALADLDVLKNKFVKDPKHELANLMARTLCSFSSRPRQEWIAPAQTLVKTTDSAGTAWDAFKQQPAAGAVRTWSWLVVLRRGGVNLK